MSRSWAVVLVAIALNGCASSDAPPPDEARFWRRPGHVEVTTDPEAFRNWTNRGAYLLGAGDVLQVSVLDLVTVGEKYVEALEVDPDGQIALPVLGQVEVANKSVSAVRDELAAALAERYIDVPQVAVTVQEYRSKEIAVLGAVARAGAVPLTKNTTTVLGAISLAGGLSASVSPRGRLLRGSGVDDGRPFVVEIDLERLNAGDLEQNYVMFPGDILQVLPAERYYVTGWVTKPGEYPFSRGTTVMEAVAIAGGMVNPDASPDMTRILRPGLSEITVDYEAIVEGELDDILLKPGDIIEVRQGFWRWAGLGLGRFIMKGVVFGYNLASLIS